MALPPFLEKIVGWLRAGYPDGVPEHDYQPLFALLGTDLSTDEITLVGAELLNADDPESIEAIKKAITSVTHIKPSESDINRVRARLAGGGWPLAVPPRD